MLPGTISIPLDKSFPTWAGWLVPYDRDVYLIVDRGEGRFLNEAVRDLAMIGLDRVAGWFSSEVFVEWKESVGELGTIPQLTPRAMAERMRGGEVAVLDVRGRGEWETGHLTGAENIPLGYLSQQLEEVPRDRPVVLHCQGGARSAIAASLLRASGVSAVFNLTGGIAAWQEAGLPVEAGASREELASAG